VPFPQLPYPGVSWPLTHHMGTVGPTSLYEILAAAAGNSESADPPAAINAYVIANDIFTADIREGKPAAWRDYQQVLSNLGLMFSTQVRRKITITPVGLSYLDGALGFSGAMATQALRLQYPNGHNLVAPAEVFGTPFEDAGALPHVQVMAGMRLRPAVLVWQVIRSLGQQLEERFLTLDEIQRFLVRCSIHADAGPCAAAVVAARHGGQILGMVGDVQDRRMLQEWLRLLAYSKLFDVTSNAGGLIRLSPYSEAHLDALDMVCTELVEEDQFWAPTDLGHVDRMSWYAYIGSIDARLELEGLEESGDLPRDKEFVGGQEVDLPAELKPSQVGNLELRDFDPANYGGPIGGDPDRKIENVYSAELLASATRLHDAMVVLIGKTALARGAAVSDDPNTVDLLINYGGVEFIVEVKTVAGRSLVLRIRAAVGQLLHYDYMRSIQVGGHRRKVVAIAATVPHDSWYLQFLNAFLNFDVLSLEGDTLIVSSTDPVALALFGPNV
jgi:hypothetical protein